VSFEITSPSNERIKWLVRLRERKHRDAEGIFVVEGERLYRRAIEAGLSPRVTFVSDRGLRSVGETVTVAPDVLDKASYRSRSQCLIAVFEQSEHGLADLETGSDPLLLVAENVEKPGNLGAMCRTAAAAGVDAIVAVGDTVDRWNPNVLRSSTGSVFSLPVVVSSWDELDTWRRNRGIRVVAASPTGGKSIWDVSLTGPLAVVIGAEDEGVSELAESIADESVAIPQAGTTVDSLNASVAAGVVLFEVMRQRTSRRS